MLRWFQTGLLALWSLTAAVAASGAVDQAAAALRQALAERFPDIKVVKILPTKWLGLYEIYTAEEIVYSNATGDWVLMGQLVDARSKLNISASNWDDFQRIDYRTLPFDKAITIVKGNGSRELAIFEDPFCPYCEELEKMLQQVDDVKVHVFLYPIEELHPGATLASQLIWCADDRASAWLEWMHKQTNPKSGNCGQSPLQELASLGRRLRINSTPTLFLPDGTRISEAIGKDSLEKLLALQRPAGATLADSSAP